ncbi:hypothetical protein MKW98_025307 [Papaver atlanticum]|uniref:Uncharacterized protein n=1 Tax=Papaver atlanticum TaxID=357466 RepID=A0AAD4S5U7_9MAGN|nr:hypothetical protein MKW98_025307 [Papaver atlanticum]
MLFQSYDVVPAPNSSDSSCLKFIRSKTPDISLGIEFFGIDELGSDPNFNSGYELFPLIVSGDWEFTRAPSAHEPRLRTYFNASPRYLLLSSSDALPTSANSSLESERVDFFFRFVKSVALMLTKYPLTWDFVLPMIHLGLKLILVSLLQM